MKIGLMGLGTVGTGVVHLINQNGKNIEKKIGEKIEIKKILVKDPNKKRTPLAEGKITFDANDILEDEEIDVVVEVMGKEHPALEYIIKALKKGKHVVTANKEVIAVHGKELIKLATENKVSLLYEASVGGGIPIIRPLKQCLAANKIYEIKGILNGTTNYILTEMKEKGFDFEEVLKEAQQKGYAEADPTDDVEGFDAARKLAILSTLAFNKFILPEKIYTKGIKSISKADIKYAEELGYNVKLIAYAKIDEEDRLEAWVHPVMIKKDNPLNGVNGVFNAILVDGNAVGEVMFYGQGAGMMPTASAVVADIMDVKNHIVIQNGCEDGDLLPIVDTVSKYYIRLIAFDKPGVMSKITGILGDKGISLLSVVQKGVLGDTAEIVLITHIANTGKVFEALEEIQNLKEVECIESVIRVEGE
ncbi:MAG: Homoserine dehydrogenase [Caldanaerobacter subterraneus]|jgi:homoserine dehydrogenase|uniref:homoserine dehydrogenase n=1 Tax=Thermoanaerobacter sp. (strain X514) TaxID=399726 RepID=UPI0000E1DE66|nr:homoserine dehydrogenase [Thermoanaerobacter sp. X514]KUK34321.1 MAG: Homoserine dehydrogenase [Caldanaerobacter subterraneus]MBZ4655876.1 homoserine dehydrogenase [Thermoanaerobacter sp.]ABY93574.1 Homoserine dehydrogenase [Thermoanaerobacter sp. X514]MDI3500357.1 homoserine dehydrogenase [Thermoanaerobacter sp.]HAA81349.1 homoserine dehydrogenase [Thermoanaerobacter sp.]